MSDNQQCTNRAEWWLTEGRGPDQYTVSCTEHLSVMVSDETSSIAPYGAEEEPCCYVVNRAETLSDQRIAEIQVKYRQRIAELEDQLDRTEKGVVRNAGRLSSERGYRWSHVANAVGCGKTTAKDLCFKHDLDPDELVGGLVSGRLTDERLAEIRASVTEDADRWDCVPSEELLALLDDVQEYRESSARQVEAQRVIQDYQAKRLADLESARDFWRESALESERLQAAREAYLAEMRREIRDLRSDFGDPSANETVDEALAIVDRYAISTKQLNEDVDQCSD